MGDDRADYPPPISVSCREGTVRITYDQVSVAIPEEGDVPADVPPLARRIFSMVRADLRRRAAE